MPGQRRWDAAKVEAKVEVKHQAKVKVEIKEQVKVEVRKGHLVFGALLTRAG